MLPSRGISKKSMAINRLNDPLDDSLESKGEIYPPRAAPVAPEEFNKKTDFQAFSADDKESDTSLYLDILPYRDFLLLQDKTSGKNRTIGVAKLQEAIESVASSSVLEINLATLVDDACAAVSDSHIKVSLAGLQLLEPLIKRTGSSLTPHLSSLVEAVLGKMSTNKCVLKKAGMKILLHLMSYSRPHDVTKEVASFGLAHKHSKVREESLNVITAALIRFPKSEFQLIQLAKEIMPSLSDVKPRVRQACMECAAKIASLCDGRDFKQVVSFAAKNGHRTDELHKMAILDALQCRIVRECPPRLKEDGLIEYGMPVIGVDIPLSEHGPDVDWIRDGILSKSGNNLEGSISRKEPKLRPYRSASKRLPWELEDADSSKTVKDRNVHVSMNETTDLSATFTLAKPSQTTTPLTHSRPSSSKLFPKEDGNSPPTHRPPTGKKRLGLSDMGVESARPTAQQSPNGNRSTALIQDLRDMVPSSRGPLPPPIPPPGSNFARRHKSLPNGVANRDLPTRSGLRKCTEFGNGSPRLSPIGSTTTFNRGPPVLDSLQRPQQVPTLRADLSESWPRSRAGVRGVGDHSRKASERIPVDSLKAIGGGYNGVRTNALRPPSKPRVRNPITIQQLREEKKLKFSLLQQQQQQQLRDSPTATEKEFLMCNNTTLTGAEDEYYSMVPEDNTTLDNSLSSSLTSLCHPTKDTGASKFAEIDSLCYIREKAASRKAQLLSAECSTSNSPEFRPSPHDEIHVGPRCRQEPTITDTIHKKAKSNAGIEHDFSKTFNAGESLAHLDPSVTTWQDLQNLTQTTPTAPPLDKPRKKKKKRKSAGDEGDGSSNGSDLVSNGRRDAVMTDRCNQDHPQENSELSPSRERKQKPKSRKVEGGLPTVKGGVRRPGPLGPERQRPSIERGGTNMIKMEVNGIKSPPPIAEQQEHSSPVARDTREIHGRKQRKPEPDFMFKEPLGQSKPPLPPTTTFPGEGLEHSDGGLPEVPHPWKKHSKYAVTRSVKDESSVGHYSGHWQNSGDGLREGGGVGGENQSPGDSELQPFSNADRGLRECLDQLENSDWNTKCEGLTAVRRLAMFHPEKLLSELHTVTLAVIEEVKNLRSSVARAAIACLGDMFIYTGRYMDSDLERVVKVLLHKTGESNVFIREDVEKTMCEIVQYATPGKLLLAIIAGGQGHRNVQVRCKAAQFLGQIVEHFGPSQLLHASRDVVEKTLTTTLNFIADAASGPRYYGRKCLSHLLMAADFEKVSSRTLNSQQWAKMKDAVETLRTKGVGDPPKEVASARSRNPTGGTVRAASHVRGTGGGRTGVDEGETKPRNPRRASQTTHGGDNPPLPDRLVERLNASNWEERQEAINVLERFVDTYPKALEPHMHKVFDAFNPRLTDRNSKVNVRALVAFSNMVPLLGDLLIPVSANVIKALMPNLASKNSTIHSAAMTVFDLISQCVDPTCLIQPIATHSQHGNARVQPIMIRKLAELTELIYSQNAKLVMRQVLPVMWHLLAGKPPGSNDVKEAIVGLCECLFNTMGHDFVNSAASQPPQSQRRLDQILQSRNFS